MIAWLQSLVQNLSKASSKSHAWSRNLSVLICLAHLPTLISTCPLLFIIPHIHPPPSPLTYSHKNDHCLQLPRPNLHWRCPSTPSLGYPCTSWPFSYRDHNCCQIFCISQMLVRVLVKASWSNLKWKFPQLRKKRTTWLVTHSQFKQFIFSTRDIHGWLGLWGQGLGLHFVCPLYNYQGALDI